MKTLYQVMKAFAVGFGMLGLSACNTSSGSVVSMQAAGAQVPGRITQHNRAAQEVGQSLNAIRAAHGVPPVVHSAALSAAAERHARDMARSGVFSHTGSDGSTPRSRVRASGFGACLYAENIAWGQATVEDAMRGWMASQGHRENNLRRAVTHYGAARAGERDYWVLVFANQC